MSSLQDTAKEGGSSQMTTNPKILVPVDTSDPADLPVDLAHVLGPMGIVVLGYYPGPDQTPPELLREEHEAEAKETMRPLVREFLEAGGGVESVLVFTRDHVETIDRIANEYACDAVLIPGAVDHLDDVLVSLKAEENMFRVLELVGSLMSAGTFDVTLYHSESVERGTDRSELYLRGATDWLVEQGLDRDRIRWEEPTEETQTSDLLSLAEAHDLVVMGETEPGIRERVLGDVPSRIHEHTGGPVLVVRRDRSG